MEVKETINKEKQAEAEPVRPERLPLGKFAYYNKYSG